jgi:hypothetical protein
MTSRQRTGLVLVVLGGFLFINNMYPDIFKEIRHLISFPVILMAIGAYLLFFRK